MRLLLDTHAVIWATVEPDRLSTMARDLIADADNYRWVSAVSAYEIDYKRPLNAELARMPADLEVVRDDLVFDWLPLEAQHASRAARLPRLHKDPWDRMLAAQAISENLTIVSIDPALRALGVPVLW